MKKILSMLLVLSMLLGCSVAMAEMGVQLIGGPDTETEPVALDDIKLEKSIDIDDYATLLPLQFSFEDTLRYTRSGYWDSDSFIYESGKDAEYAILRMDMLNLSTTAKNYLSNCEVRVIFDDKYEYAGWYHQYDYDRREDRVVYPGEEFAINPMYQGHYVFGCTLPNAVVNSKSPLRLVIAIDGNEITYNIRK